MCCTNSNLQIVEGFVVCVSCGATKENVLQNFQQQCFLINQHVPHRHHLSVMFKEFEMYRVESRQVTVDAFNLYNKVYNSTRCVKRGNVREGVKAACLYYTLRLGKNPLKLEHVAEICNVSKKSLVKGYNYITNSLV